MWNQGGVNREQSRRSATHFQFSHTYVPDRVAVEAEKHHTGPSLEKAQPRVRDLGTSKVAMLQPVNFLGTTKTLISKLFAWFV